MKLHLSQDTGSLALGAGAIARALAAEATRRNLPLTLTRTGSRGLYWLEPLLEVDTPDGRIAYGPLTPEDIPSLLDALPGGEHPRRLGPVNTLLVGQQRRTFARCGAVDPASLADYRDHGGLTGVARALALGPEQVLSELDAAGLRGLGGAAFPAARKWRTVLEAPVGQKYIVCNADEGDSGTYADRLLMEGDPFLLIEGMLIAGLTLGASDGFIYVRSEYPLALDSLRRAVEAATEAGLLGENAAGSGRRFTLHLRRGAEAYVCGEETSLLESLEGRRGMVRAKPPLPALQGLFGKPTLVHNVLTLAAVPQILAMGGAVWAEPGLGRSRGTVAVPLAGNLKRAGLFEVPYGTPLATLLHDFGGGSASGRPLKAVQVGGPLGAYLSPAQFDTPLDYESFAAAGGMLGHGGVVAFDDTADMASLARYAMDFCARESCGKCTPCRIGSTRGVEVIDRLRDGDRQQLPLLQDLCTTMRHASLCALGGLTPLPVISAVRHYPQDFGLSAEEVRHVSL